jgi:hypothetical protein
VPKTACPMSLGFASQEIQTLITHEELKAGGPPPWGTAGARGPAMV